MRGFKTITEGDAKILVPSETKVSAKMPVFYNPVMKFNRDVSILLLNALGRKKMRIALPLAGTGVRGLRFLTELNKGVIEEISFNDGNPKAVDIIKRNIDVNLDKIDVDAKISLSQREASKFLLEAKQFDYIDVDPFGNPGPFLDATVKRLAREGILAVTATDTSALCGTYPRVCKRKYWSTPNKSPLMHETGLRILIRKVQLVASQYEKALVPLLSYSRDHYMRAFFVCSNSRTETDSVIKLHGMLGDVGPLWLGSLNDPDLLRTMIGSIKDEKEAAFLRLLRSESGFPPGFYDIHAISEEMRLRSIPKFEHIMREIIKKKHKVSRTHFSRYGLKSDMDLDDLKNILR
ncbi:MAG: hypothetical protein ACE5DM_02840 [Candidatus Nanoarchaeia archaeon]